MLLRLASGYLCICLFFVAGAIADPGVVLSTIKKASNMASSVQVQTRYIPNISELDTYETHNLKVNKIQGLPNTGALNRKFMWATHCVLSETATDIYHLTATLDGFIYLYKIPKNYKNKPIGGYEHCASLNLKDDTDEIAPPLQDLNVVNFFRTKKPSGQINPKLAEEIIRYLGMPIHFSKAFKDANDQPIVFFLADNQVFKLSVNISHTPTLSLEPFPNDTCNECCDMPTIDLREKVYHNDLLPLELRNLGSSLNLKVPVNHASGITVECTTTSREDGVTMESITLTASMDTRKSNTSQHPPKGNEGQAMINRKITVALPVTEDQDLEWIDSPLSKFTEKLPRLNEVNEPNGHYLQPNDCYETDIHQPFSPEGEAGNAWAIYTWHHHATLACCQNKMTAPTQTQKEAITNIQNKPAAHPVCHKQSQILYLDLLTNISKKDIGFDFYLKEKEKGGQYQSYKHGKYEPAKAAGDNKIYILVPQEPTKNNKNIDVRNGYSMNNNPAQYVLNLYEAVLPSPEQYFDSAANSYRDPYRPPNPRCLGAIKRDSDREEETDGLIDHPFDVIRIIAPPVTLPLL